MAELFLQSEVRDMLETAVEGNQTRWARANGVSPAYVSDVICGRRDPGPSIARALGLEPFTVYRTIAAPAREQQR